MRFTKIDPKIIFKLCGLILFTTILYLSYTRAFDAYELNLLDLRYKLRPAIKTDPKIVFIEIADDSIEKLGSWPFDRKYHALLVDALKDAGAEKIVFDIFFSEEREGDIELAQSIKSAGNVYLPFVFRLGKLAEFGYTTASEYDAHLIDVLKNPAKNAGHINIIPDQDGKFRRIPPFLKYQEKLYPQISFLASLDHLGLSVTETRPGRYIILSDGTKIPLDIYSNMIINFPGKWEKTYRHYSYVDVLNSYMASLEGGKGPIDLAGLKGAICFIGITATAAPDAHPSPLEPLYPGVGIHASLLNSMISKHFISRAGKFTNIVILLILLFLTYLDTKVSRKRVGIIYILTLGAGFFLTGYILFLAAGIWVDLFYPLVVMVFMYLVLTFMKYLSEMQKREVLEKELSIAKNIQESFLPTGTPDVKGVAIEAKMNTARQVGGDLYDFFTISDKKLGIMIGDVSGKGVPAALFMAKVVSEFKPFVREPSPCISLSKVNKKLSDEARTSLFVTAVYLVFDMEKMELTYSFGGHLPVILLREGEPKALLLDSKDGMPLGLMDCDFSDTKVELKKGDIFILYTDGVTEAMNAKNEEFGEDRLVVMAEKNKDKPIKDIVESIHKEVKKFEGKLPQHDDITVIAVKVE